MLSTIEKDLICTNNNWVLTRKEYPNWYGIPDIGFIYHNNWEDPEIEYKGKRFNSHDIQDTMWEYFNEACEESTIKPTDDGFGLYTKDNQDLVYEMLDMLI